MNDVSKLTPLKPPCLKQGDTLGLVAPSLPLMPSSAADYEAGKQTLQSLGFRLQEGRTVHLRRWWSETNFFRVLTRRHQQFRDELAAAGN